MRYKRPSEMQELALAKQTTLDNGANDIDQLQSELHLARISHKDLLPSDYSTMMLPDLPAHADQDVADNVK